MLHNIRWDRRIGKIGILQERVIETDREGYANGVGLGSVSGEWGRVNGE